MLDHPHLETRTLRTHAHAHGYDKEKERGKTKHFCVALYCRKAWASPAYRRFSGAGGYLSTAMLLPFYLSARYIWRPIRMDTHPFIQVGP